MKYIKHKNLFTIFFLLCIIAASCLSIKNRKIKIYDSIEFEKSACLKNCTPYKILIDYKGNYNYQKLGRNPENHIGILNKKTNKNFWNFIESARLDTMKTEYDYGAEDSQQKFLRYTINNSIKEIRFGHQVPPILKKIDAEVEKIASSIPALK